MLNVFTFPLSIFQISFNFFFFNERCTLRMLAVTAMSRLACTDDSSEISYLGKFTSFSLHCSAHFRHCSPQNLPYTCHSTSCPSPLHYCCSHVHSCHVSLSNPRTVCHSATPSDGSTCSCAMHYSASWATHFVLQLFSSQSPAPSSHAFCRHREALDAATWWTALDR